MVTRRQVIPLLCGLLTLCGGNVKAADSATYYDRVVEMIATNSGASVMQTYRSPEEMKAEQKLPEKPVYTQVPVKVDADKMYYSDKSGEVWAEGNVYAVQANREIRTERVEGNTKEQLYRAVGKVNLQEDKGLLSNLDGNGLAYNARTGEAKIDDVFGLSQGYYVKGKEGKFDGKNGFVKEGWLTTKHAMAFEGTPDYRVEGDNIEIYPNDKAIVHNARFYIHGFRFLTLGRYVTSLKKGKGPELISFMPRPTYSSSNGFGLKGNISYPFNTNTVGYFNYRWLSKVGFKPQLGVTQYMPWGTINLEYSKEDSELWGHKVWIEKVPELSIKTHTYRLGKSPFTVWGKASLGYWKEDNIQGSHNLLQGELSHDPLKFWHGASLRAYMGYQRDYYSYDDTVRSNPYWGFNLSAKLGNRLNTWVGYRDNHTSERSPYLFDTIEISRNLVMGAAYKLTRLDTLAVSTQRNVENGNLEYVDYTWYRDMHSMAGTLTYRSKQREWQYTLTFKDF